MLNTVATTPPNKPWTDAGIPTFPCCPESKRPACRTWRPKDSSSGQSRPLTLNEAKECWSAPNEPAKAMMVGLDCEAAGILVIDLDRNKADSHGSDGVAEFKKLCAEAGISLDSCMRVDTPSGGQHLYFADPMGRWGNTTSVLASGVDTRGVGGFIIAPGSHRKDGVYVPVEPAELKNFIDAVSKGSLPLPPPALAALLDAKCPSKKSKQARRSNAPADLCMLPKTIQQNSVISSLPELGEWWTLPKACSIVAAAIVGRRNDTMSRVAFTMGLRASTLGLSREVVVDALMDAARGAGWDDEAKTLETAERQFAEGFARALTQGTSVPNNNGHVGQGAAGVTIGIALGQRDVQRATERTLGQLGVVSRRDIFKDAVVISNGPNGILPPVHEGAISDNACRWLAKRLRDNHGMKVNWATVYEALADVAEHDTFNPVADWLNGLQWDGVARLDTWLPKATGADVTPLACAAGVLVLQAMVMRARWPGSKFDSCLVLEGPQGLGKSSLAAAMCDGPGADYFCDTPGLLAMDGKTRGEQLRGKWVVELAELAGLHKREAEEIKAFISVTADQYRPAYGRNAVKQLRTSVFIGTTNAQQYLQDITGNRRFIPITCKKTDIAWFRQNRDQLFAEADARTRALAGSAPQGRPLPLQIAEKFALPRQHWAALEELTEDRREASPLEILLPSVLEDLLPQITKLGAKGPYITAGQLIDRLQLSLPKVSTSGLAVQMRRLGWESARIGKERKRVYCVPRAVARKSGSRNKPSKSSAQKSSHRR